MTTVELWRAVTPTEGRALMAVLKAKGFRDTYIVARNKAELDGKFAAHIEMVCEAKIKSAAAPFKRKKGVWAADYERAWERL